MADCKGDIDRRGALLGGLAGLLLPGVARAGTAVAPGKIPRPEVAFRVPDADLRVGGLVNGVAQARIRSDVDALTGFATRWSEATDFGAVETWVARALQAGGGQPAARQSYALLSGTLRNNILAGNPTGGRGVILVGAHVDDMSERPGDLAPGANDNASGVAALLEAQRVLSAHAFEREIVYAVFSGEEQDLAGSTAAARIAAREGWPIELMINVDMVGLRPATAAAPLFIEYDQANATTANDPAALAYATMAAAVAAEHAGLATTFTNIWDSDYMPFEAQGFACIGFYDGGADRPEFHTTRDLPALLDYPRLTQVTRALVATVATAAEMSG
jgi:Zn-dependent M28 family amino/carboxypeptidase